MPRDDLTYRWQEFLEVGYSTCGHCFDPDNTDPLQEENLVYINFLPARDLRIARIDPLFVCATCGAWVRWMSNAEPLFPDLPPLGLWDGTPKEP